MRKILTKVLLLLTLTFLLVSCKNDVVKSEMSSVNIDFNVSTVDNGTMEFDYPIDEWEEATSPFAGVPVLLMSTEYEEVNINVVSASDVEVSLEEYLKAIPTAFEQIEPSIQVVLAEIRTIGDIEIAYNENSIKYTEETIEKGIEMGIYTEDLIEASGGREALLSIPESKQIQMTLYLDDKSVTITGSYSDDSQKEAVLKAMTTMVQTAKTK